MSSFTPRALVTGASSGIGAAYADRLAARGYDLVLVARRQARLEQLATRLRAEYGRNVDILPADLADPDGLAQVEQAVSTAPDLTLLANIAGLGAWGQAVAVDPDAMEAMLKVNVLALTRLSLAAARRFAAARHGTIINIGSVITVVPLPGTSGYSGSKAYVFNFSRSLQNELASSGVTVQVVMPGPVRSDFFGDSPPPFPDRLFMSAETLADTALTALDQGETITFPNLDDVAAWQAYEDARKVLVKNVVRTGEPAPRYTVSPT